MVSRHVVCDTDSNAVPRAAPLNQKAMMPLDMSLKCMEIGV